MGARNQVVIKLSYRPARLHIIEELIPQNQFSGYLKVFKYYCGPVRQTYSYSVPSPHRLFKNSSTVLYNMQVLGLNRRLATRDTLTLCCETAMKIVIKLNNASAAMRHDVYCNIQYYIDLKMFLG
jgi:hypothetical protein